MKINFINNTKNNINKTNISNKIKSFASKKDPIFAQNIRLTIHIVSKQSIHNLNQKFRNIDKPTDVLSFPIYKNITEIKLSNSKSKLTTELGDIFVCYDIANLQSQENHQTTEKEIEHLSLHGFKHLIGIHHK